MKLKKYLAKTYVSFLDTKKKTIAYLRGKTIKNRDFTIISDNCWGGFIYQRYGIKYQTPTIGLFFYPEDYIKFLERLDYYLSLDVEVKTREFSKYADRRPERQYYIGMLDDVEIQFLHYKTPEEIVEKWNKRKARINMDKCLIKMSNRSVLFTSDIYDRFEKLPYKNKILFTRENVNFPHCIYVPEFESIIDNTVSEIPYTMKHCNIRRIINEL
ncbi:MAG: DUF1919 domain-containing protein [Clostridia bacterium]|nr:DUF1919 domain-containing protein [Clostridia bacterium]